MKKVLFLDSVHPILKDRLEKLGLLCEEDFACSKEMLLEKIADYEGIVIRSRIRIDQDIIEKAAKLKFIARSGSGLENIDLHTAEEAGIRCFNSPEGNCSAVAEHVIGMLLSLFNNLKRADSEVRKGQWKREENRGLELEGRTIGIIGCGNTGGALAKKLSGFGMNILVFDKYVKNLSTSYFKQVSLEELQFQSDIISFHVPLSNETHHYFNSDFLKKVKENIFLINASRGPVVSSLAVVEGLKTGQIAGACLDVLENEKPSFEKLESEGKDEVLDYLINSEKVILSPHIAGWTTESYFKLSEVLAQKIEDFYSK